MADGEEPLRMRLQRRDLWSDQQAASLVGLSAT
jgi:hypothetical protein